jgi:geranylgeranylglycerol-phosphate geranylgeranyltransferase
MKYRFIRLLRPIAWITFFFPFAVGFGIGITPQSSIFHVIFAFIAFICWMSFCFTVNAIGDTEVDKFHDGRSKDMNLSNQPLVTGEISKKVAFIIALLFLFSSLLFAYFINPLFFILIIIVDTFGYVYSMEPTRFKSKPTGDILCNALAAGAIFVAGLSIGGKNMDPLIILAAFIMASIFYIPTVVTDHEFDKKVGLKTSAVFFGPKKMLQSMYIQTILLLIVGLVLILFSNIELKVLAILMMLYAIIFTLAANIKLKQDRLYLHENWILVPFLLLSILFVIFGILKIMGLIVIQS